jgi:hypothetical protein
VARIGEKGERVRKPSTHDLDDQKYGGDGERRPEAAHWSHMIRLARRISDPPAMLMAVVAMADM